MKSTYFTKIIDETTIEVDDSRQGTIDKLRQQNGVCYSTDGNQTELRFNCSKRGKISIDNNLSGRSIDGCRFYYVVGEVLSEKNKTVVKIYSIYRKDEWIFRILAILIYLVTIMLYFLIKLKSGSTISAADIFGVLLLGVIMTIFVFSSTKELEHRDTDLALMRDEVVKRVEAIKRWDD